MTHERERVGAMERYLKSGQLWPCQGAPKVIVVLVEELWPLTGSDGAWVSRPELTKVFTHTDAGRVAAREYGMSLDANTYAYDIVTRQVE